ncbi:helix-turn-helix domain-containing protein [Metabacillus dongyingensis]|uniref:helix-turn-helix domain-containing protein n=1 Tax=Metabacillus dongyingensis TaxID=2874282 RepID=UPI003B8E76B1
MDGYKLYFDHLQKKKGLNDSELARRLQVSRAAMSQLRNRRGIQFDTLYKLCMILECEPKDIIVEYEVK